MYSILTDDSTTECSVYLDGMHVYTGSYDACIAYLDMIASL